LINYNSPTLHITKKKLCSIVSALAKGASVPEEKIIESLSKSLGINTGHDLISLAPLRAPGHKPAREGKFKYHYEIATSLALVSHFLTEVRNLSSELLFSQ